VKRPDTFVSFDVETTGLDPNLYEIIEIGAVKVENGEFAEQFDELVKPVGPIPEFITALTGITRDDVADAPPVADVLSRFREFSRGHVLMGQNVGFDISFLRKVGGYGAFGPAIDNIEFARIILPQLPAYNLDSLMEFFAIEPDSRHRALADAKATALVFLKLLNMLRMMPPDFATEMHQIASRTGSAIDGVFESHLRERLARLGSGAPSVPPAPPAIPVRNNIYGSVLPDREPDETGATRIDQDAISDGLASGGLLSHHHPEFEERTGQRLLCRAIGKAFNDSEILLAEAGTGIGKSIAYLLPAIHWAETTGERVIVSTNTKNLQEQLFNKDIPLLGETLGFPFRAVILKGRSNYVCLNRWHRLAGGGDKYLSSREKSMLLPVAAWLNHTITGDISETGFYQQVIESGLLEKINADSPFCVGGRCRHREQCFVNRIRKAAQRSHIIIVNHSLVFSDMASDGGVLGSYSRIVFDEAHNIEKTALRFLGVTMSPWRIRRMLNRLYGNLEGPEGLLAQLAEWGDEMVRAWPAFAPQRTIIETAMTMVDAVRNATSRLFDHLNSLVREEAAKSPERHEGKLRYDSGSPVFDKCREELDEFEETAKALHRAVGDVVLVVSEVSSAKLADREEIMIELEELREEIEASVNDLVFLAEAEGRNVFWFEYNENGTVQTLRIQSAPLDVAEKLAYGLFDHLETVVLTSATLTVARDFSYIRNRLGINIDTRERAVEFIAESPFDYRRQAAVVIPSYLPSPKDPEFIEKSNDLILSLASEIGRGMLVLFTSRSHMHQTYYELKDRFSRRGILLMAQDIDGSRQSLLRRFQEDARSVLFGTDSFWEGVDVPGHALEVVVISRIPFAVPTDPVIQAQSEEVERLGMNPFMGFTVPEAAIKLRQGAGRLIRHRNDRGVVVVCDTRVLTTRWGPLFMKSLPGMTLRAESPELLIERIKTWFAG
jgi:predicted DnaQ family exonuclease/DinG family helicase